MTDIDIAAIEARARRYRANTSTVREIGADGITATLETWWQVAADREVLLDALRAAEVREARLRAERDHYLAGCACPLRPTCVPHGWAGTEPEHHGICADHDHAALASTEEPKP